MDNLGNFTAGHPSFFQNPQMDKIMLDNISVAKLTDPNELWQKKMSVTLDKSRSQFTVPYDKNDPPFSEKETRNLIAKLDPVIDKTLDNIMPSLLFYFFFSKQNIANIQKSIRYAVNKWSGHHVGDQSLIELTLIMEHIFSSHAKHMDEKRAPTKILLQHIRNQIQILNEFVINEAVPLIVDKVEQHVSYMDRVENPLTSLGLSRPQDTKITGTKLYRASTDVLNTIVPSGNMGHIEKFRTFNQFC